MTTPIVLLAPAPNLGFGGAPSGAAYTSDNNALVVITNGSTADEAALIAAGCTAVQTAVFGAVTSVSMTGDGVTQAVSVPGSPITSVGSLAPSPAVQNANTVIAGPASGAPGALAARALVNADMPSSGRGSGSVASVALSCPSVFSVTGSPITASGTLAVSLANQAANEIFAGPSSGSAAAPTFRALVIGDLPFAGAANGVATLNAGGTLATSQIPPSLIGAVVYEGTWNASTNSPTLASGVGTKGNYYKVSTAGTATIDGNSQWNVGDTIIFDGTTWDKIDGVPNEVQTVFGRYGAVTAQSGDYGFSQISGTASSSQLPAATTSAQGAVIPDGTTISISGSTISVASQNLTPTPTITFGTPGNLSVSYATQACNFWQVGPLCLLSIILTFTPTYTTASGIFSINGLSGSIPAPAAGVQGTALFNGISLSSGYTQLIANLTTTPTVRLAQQGSGLTSTSVSTTNLPSGSACTVEVTLVYYTTTAP